MTTTRETADHIGEANEKVTADHAELARLAEARMGYKPASDTATSRAGEAALASSDSDRFRKLDGDFRAAFTPAVCSALLSEIAALRGAVAVREGQVNRLFGLATQAERQRDEAVGPLRELADGGSQRNNINEYDDLSVRASTLPSNQGAD